LLPVQSASPLASLRVTAVLEAAANPTITLCPKIFEEFSLLDRVDGGNCRLGFEMALTLCEADACAIYCINLSARPGEKWEKMQEYVRR
jgi:hypothetical protein